MVRARNTSSLTEFSQIYQALPSPTGQTDVGTEGKKAKDYSTSSPSVCSGTKRTVQTLAEPETRAYWSVRIEIRICNSQPRTRFVTLRHGGACSPSERNQRIERERRTGEEFSFPDAPCATSASFGRRCRWFPSINFLREMSKEKSMRRSLSEPLLAEDASVILASPRRD